MKPNKPRIYDTAYVDFSNNYYENHFYKPIVIFLYGFELNYNDEYEEPKNGTEMFCVPDNSRYNEKNGNRFIGIQFATINSPFDNLYYSKDKFQMSNDKPSIEIINKMKNLYPDKDLKCHAYFRGIPCYTYLNGNIMIGNFSYIKTRDPYKFDYYYRNIKGFESEENDDDEYGSQIDEEYDLNEIESEEIIPKHEYFKQLKKRVHKYRELKKERLLKKKDNNEITVKISKHLSNRLVDGFNVFIGQNIGPIFNSGKFPFGNKLYEFLTTKYENSDKNKIIAFIPIKCYCGDEFCDKH